MLYEGMIYRPPSEAKSLILQVTVGCSHNKCTFCPSYKLENFRVKKIEELAAYMDELRQIYGYSERVFLCDGNVLCLSNDRLLPVMELVKKNFPECKRIGSYARAKDILRKTDDELKTLKDAGLGIVYIGCESGSDKVLERIKKGETADELCEAVTRVEALGIPCSTTFLSGAGGSELWEEHAVKSGELISRMQPSYASLLTLLLEEPAPILDEYRSGKFQLLTPIQVMYETRLLIENINLTKKCVFRSNHASNYLALKGVLPDEKERFLMIIDDAVNRPGILKNEWWRRL